MLQVQHHLLSHLEYLVDPTGQGETIVDKVIDNTKEVVEPNGPTKQDLDVSVSAETLIQVVEEGAQIYSEITASFISTFVFYDKTLYQWANEMMINIPDNIDENQFRSTLILLANNLQIAQNYFSVASSMADAISGGGSIRRSDVISAIVFNYAKTGARRPAATVIEKMADSYMSSTVSARVAAQIVKSFWKQRIDTLLELRKILEQVGMSLHMEMKWTNMPYQQ